MDRRGFRKIILLIGGVLVAAISTIFMLLLDTQIKSTVYHLFGLAVFGLGGGILQVVGALNSHDEEHKHAWWMLLISCFMNVALMLTLSLVCSDVSFVGYLSSTEKSLVSKFFIILFALLTGVFGAINTILTFILGIRVIREHLKYVEFVNNKKSKVALTIVKKSLGAFAFLLVALAFVSIICLPLLSGSYSFRKVEGLSRIQTTITYVVSGFGLLLGKPVEMVKMSFVEVLLNNDIPDVLTTEMIEISMGFNPIVYLSLFLIVFSSIASLLFVSINKTERLMWIRTILGLVLLFSGFVSFTYSVFIMRSLESIVEPEVVFASGIGTALFSLLVILGGVIYSFLPVFEVKNRVKRLTFVND